MCLPTHQDGFQNRDKVYWDAVLKNAPHNANVLRTNES